MEKTRFDQDSLIKESIFSNLNKKDLEIISELAVMRKYSRGSLIFHEGDPGEALYYVQKGKIKIFKNDYEGREQILHIMKAGDVFGEVVLFDDGPYPASAEVMEDTVVGFISKERFDQHLMGHPEIAIKMIKLLGSRLRKAQAKVADLALKDTYRRTVSTLYNLMEEDDCAFCENKTKVAISATHQELASMVGTTRESVTRVLSILKYEGVIETNKGYIWVTDPVELSKKVTE